MKRACYFRSRISLRQLPKGRVREHGAWRVGGERGAVHDVEGARGGGGVPHNRLHLLLETAARGGWHPGRALRGGGGWGEGTLVSLPVRPLFPRLRLQLQVLPLTSPTSPFICTFEVPSFFYNVFLSRFSCFRSRLRLIVLLEVEFGYLSYYFVAKSITFLLYYICSRFTTYLLPKQSCNNYKRDWWSFFFVLWICLPNTSMIVVHDNIDGTW